MNWLSIVLNGPLVKIPVMPLPQDIIDTNDLHHCSICDEDKPSSEFSVRENGELRGQCKSCRYKLYKKKSIPKEYPDRCAYCGGHLNQLNFGKPLKYCSIQCRDKYWVMKKKQSRMKNANK